MYADYRAPDTEDEPAGGGLSWWTLLTHWRSVSADLAQFYAFHEYAHPDAPWPWVQALIAGLADIPDSRLRTLAAT